MSPWGNATAFQITPVTCLSDAARESVHTSVCPRHSEAKQTEMSEFGAEKGFLQGRARRRGGPGPEKSQAPRRVLTKRF